MLELIWEEDEPLFENADKAKIEFIFREFLDDIADYAVARLRENVPVESGRTFDAINRGNVEKTAFGWQVEVGIRPIEDLEVGEPEYYPLFVHEGTGLFGPRHKLIEPLHGNVMVFEVGDKVIFTKYTQGQDANPFLDDTFDQTDHYVTLKKREVAAAISALL